MNHSNAETWRVVLRTDRAADPVTAMRGNEAQCRMVARSIVGMTVAGDGPEPLGRVIEAWGEPVPEGATP